MYCCIIFFNCWRLSGPIWFRMEGSSSWISAQVRASKSAAGMQMLACDEHALLVDDGPLITYVLAAMEAWTAVCKDNLCQACLAGAGAVLLTLGVGEVHHLHRARSNGVAA